MPKQQTLKGFRDFLPSEKKLRDQIAHSIKTTFETFGFEPLQTPTLEYASLLLGKYGTDADKLVYTFQDKGKRQVGLRYDQTVPTARVLSQYQHQLPRYFRRYQIQNVFRADKPQKGRYREFTQADIDIFGTTSPLADAEILACTYATFKNLGFKDIHLHLNDRQLLFKTLQPYASDQLSVFSIIQSIDKLDKLTQEEVIQELAQKGLNQSQAKQAIKDLQNASPTPNLTTITQLAKNLGVPASHLVFTPTLARGLDYYTGLIFEITLPQLNLGSLGGGGRYDHLIHDLGGPQIPAVGTGLGFDRIVEAVKAQNLISTSNSTTQVLATIIDNQYLPQLLQLVTNLRQHSIATEIYPQPEDNIRKQITYGVKKQIPYLIFLGENEVKHKTVTLKNLQSHQQKTIPISELISTLSNG